MPEPELSNAQLILMKANKCPDVDEPQGEKTDSCWNTVSVNRLSDWVAVPHQKGEFAYVVAEFK